MKRMIFLMLIILSATSVVACSDDNGAESPNDVRDKADTADENEDASPGADAGLDTADENEDVSPGADAGLDADNEDEPDVCEPAIIECAADQCGEIDDGCGNVIECQPCPCEAGVAIVESCGVCGLGKQSCGSGETGFGVCDAPEMPGLSNDSSENTCELKLIFVDSGEAPGGDGSKAAPFNTYADALSAASAGKIIVLGGQSSFTEVLEVKNGVSVIGGFSSKPDFRWDRSQKANFEVGASDNDDVFGIKAENIDQNTLLKNIHVTTEDAEETYSNYGAYILGSDKLSLHDVEVRAGKGGRGADGEHGEAGNDGKPGEKASDMGFDSPGPGQMTFKIPKGGLNEKCPIANGGRGGKGSWASGSQSAPGGWEQHPAGRGEGTSGASGGEGGQGINGYRAGGNGADGAGVGSDIRHGQGGTSGGAISNNLWNPDGAGLKGQEGQHGHGGGGGGGMYPDDEISMSASPGGGGGAGGCGGKPGFGGQPGGGSFGALLVRSDILVVDSSFVAGIGGEGGKGGLGGGGGQGAPGGQGTNKVLRDDYSPVDFLGWSSGDGGHGSDGINGGAGGGGAGGVSYGVYCSQSRLERQGEVEFRSAGQGRGGASAGNEGAKGISKAEERCN